MRGLRFSPCSGRSDHCRLGKTSRSFSSRFCTQRNCDARTQQHHFVLQNLDIQRL